MHSANQIAVFVDHQFLWKKSSDFFVAFHPVGLQAKAASEKVAVWSDFVRSAFHAIRLDDCLIINILQENQLMSQFFVHAVFWMDLASYVQIMSNCIPRFFRHQYPWKKSIYTFVWPLPFCLFFFLFISWHHLPNFAEVHLIMTLIMSCIYFA